jgi:hypothetical protein
MPPKTTESGLTIEEKVELDEILHGPLGCGNPVRIAHYPLVGNSEGPLRALFGRNLHPSADEMTIWRADLLPLTKLSLGFWDRFRERIGDLRARQVYDWDLINTWTPTWRDFVVQVYRSPTGDYLHIPQYQDRISRLDLVLRTDHVRLRATKPRAEKRARKRLLEDLDRRQSRELLLTGAFVEIGRSGVHYRIGFDRPTIAYRSWKIPGSRRKAVRFLATLCFHEVGYYDGTFAGCKSPSDEMRVHLGMIRASEHYYWRKANQHEIDDPLGGL